MLNVSKLWLVAIIGIATVAAAATFAAIDNSPTPANAGLSTCSTQAFLSEYVEGSSNNKAVEIYNGSDLPIDLSLYAIQIYSNGSSTGSGLIALSGSVAAGDVHVLAAQDILGLQDQISAALNFNGNDAVALTYGGLPIDVIGQIGVDPGIAGWSSGGATTANGTLQRQGTVIGGRTDNVDFNTVLPAEWTGFASDTFDGLGSHTAECFTGVPATPTNTPVVPTATPSNSGSVLTTINAVDAPGPCLLLSTDSIDYGTLAFSTSLTSRSATGELTITTCNAEPEDILARGADATGASATWTLANPPPSGNMCEEEFEGGTNVFAHTLPDLALTTTNQTYLSSLAADTVVSQQTTFMMPCSGSDGAGELMSTSITFTAVASNQ